MWILKAKNFNYHAFEIELNIQRRVTWCATKYFPTSPIYYLPVWKRAEIYIGVQVPILDKAYTICHQLFM